MKAAVGDRIIVQTNRVGQPAREGRIVEVRGADGSPPYVVRWSEESEGLFFPGSDARVEPGDGD